MRIIGGRLKRQRLESPPEGSTTRPMPDMVREAIFNLLRGHVEGQAIIDCFSGTGTMGLEAVSRGADRVVLVERDRRVVRLLEKNIEQLGVEDECDVVAGDALGPAAWSACPKPVHLVFFDPPYAMVRDDKDWPRVRDAFGRLVGLLDREGFGVLRTPWPFTRESEQEGEPPIDVSLEIEGAIGPETHVYRNTAVHLYMKDPGLFEGDG